MAVASHLLLSEAKAATGRPCMVLAHTDSYYWGLYAGIAVHLGSRLRAMEMTGLVDSPKDRQVNPAGLDSCPLSDIGMLPASGEGLKDKYCLACCMLDSLVHRQPWAACYEDLRYLV